MLTQCSPKQEQLREEIGALVDQFLAAGGKIKVLAGFTVRKPHDPNYCFGFYGADYATTKPLKSNPSWTNAKTTRDLIIFNKIFQKDVAKELGLTQGQLGTYLHKRGNPTPELAQKIEFVVAEMIAKKQAEA